MLDILAVLGYQGGRELLKTLADLWCDVLPNKVLDRLFRKVRRVDVYFKLEIHIST